MPIGMDEDTLLNVLLCMGGTRKLEGLLLDGDAVPGTTVRGVLRSESRSEPLASGLAKNTTERIMP